MTEETTSIKVAKRYRQMMDTLAARKREAGKKSTIKGETEKAMERHAKAEEKKLAS